MSLFSNYIPFKIELERYIEHCKTIFEQIGDSSSASLVDGFIKDLDNQRYNITIIGSLKRGKSTLLNTLMERHDDCISPISSNVCTSAIIKYLDKNMTRSKNECAIVYFDANQDGGVPQALTIPFQQLKNYITEEQNPENRKRVKSVEVYGDFPEWSKAVTIIDSPGQNSVFSHHDTLLSDFLPYTDAIIFLVAADIPLDGGDIALLKELTDDEKRKIFFVLTKVDNIDNPDDLEDVKSFVLGKIQETGLSCDKLYTVSAKHVYDALLKGVTGPQLDAIKAENGILELEEDLEKFIVAESDQTRILRSRVEMLLNKTSEACNKYISTSNELLSQKEYDLTVLEAERKDLLNANDQLRENTKKALKKFNRSWDKALCSFQRKFSSKAGVVEDRINDSLQHGGLWGAVFQSFKLQKQVQSAIGMELQPLILDLEEKLEEVITTLNSEFDDELSLYVKRKNGTDAGSVTGSAFAVAAMTGTVTWGISATNGAISSAMSAFGAWQTAAAASTTASAANSTAAVGALAKFWGWLWGTGKATETATVAANAAANAANAASSAIVAGVTAVVTAGVSIAVTLLVQKILHMLLISVQGTRVVGITEKIMNDMEDALFKSLDVYKESLIKEYQQNIDDMLADNTERLDEIKDIFENDDSAERKLITEHLVEVKGLLSEGVHVQKQIPLLQ
jgi:GTPase Era involved in 16S rRNA processing